MHRAPTRFGRILLLNLAVALTLLIYCWSATSSSFTLSVKGPQDDYYNRLTDAFRAGQLHLQIEPHPALLALPDPYDPAANAPYRVHDASLYRGKYYLYFGVGPVVTLLLPFNLITGDHIPQALAILLFASAGFLFAVALLWRLRADYFPRVPQYADGLVALMFGFATYVPLLLRRSMIYEVAVASAFCGSMLLLLALYRAWHSSKPWPWLMLAGFAGGLVVASRPNLTPGLMGVIAIAVLAIWTKPASSRRRLLALAALGLPLTVWAAGLMAYNYARFENPLEFGMRYALGGYDISKWQAFSPRYLSTSLAYHLFSPVGFSAYFPFIYPAGLNLSHVPRGYALTESVIGILPALPAVWLVPIAAWLAWRRRHDGHLGRFVLGALLAGTVHLFVHGCFGAATARYQVDFLPPLLLTGSVAAFYLLSTDIPLCRLVRLATIAALVYSTAFGFLFSIQYLSLLRNLNPELFRSLAMIFNRPAEAWEKHRGLLYGPLRLRLQMPERPVPGTYETLLHTGRSGAENVIYLHYLPDSMARVGLHRTGSGGPVSAPFRIVAGEEYEVEIHHNSLLPPFGHPALPALSVVDDALLRRRFAVLWNGQPVLRASLSGHEATAFQRAIACNQTSRRLFADFSGRLLRAEYLLWSTDALPREQSTPEGGDIRLQVLFPMESRQTREPLVSLPVASGILVYAQYLADERIQIGVSRPGFDDILSGPIVIDRLQSQQIDIASEVLLPSSATEANVSSRLRVELNGDLLMDLDLALPPGERTSEVAVTYGVNPFNRVAISPRFMGQILAIERRPRAIASAPQETPIGPVLIVSDLPLAMIGVAEPLVVTGREGRGDFVYIRYQDKDHVTFGYDHWGYGGATSEPVKVDYRQMHHIEVRLGSLFPADRIPASTPPEQARRVREVVEVVLNGKVVLSAPAVPYDCQPEEVYLVSNPIGGSTCRDRFTGRVAFVKRLPWP